MKFVHRFPTQIAVPFGYGNKMHQISVKLVQNYKKEKKRKNKKKTLHCVETRHINFNEKK